MYGRPRPEAEARLMGSSNFATLTSTTVLLLSSSQEQMDGGDKQTCRSFPPSAVVMSVVQVHRSGGTDARMQL